ncbi:MAG: DNA polymerase Y family protein [Burkholderiales bacterium]|nr:DNA polymerase Y family protein [Burkholderiales bacterium]
MLWSCLHFPDLSLQLLLRASPADQALVVHGGGNRPQILSCNPSARSTGIAAGMSLSAAIALCPDLQARPRDAGAEHRALGRIAGWAGQFTPVVSIDAPDAVLLEIEGSLALFGGLPAMQLRLSQDLAELGYAAAIATAPTPGAARLLARAGISRAVTKSAQLPDVLHDLPLTLLAQPEDTLRALALMGVRSVGACLDLPREGVARRFGQGLLDELDRALGRLPDPRTPYCPPAHYRARLPLPAPVHETGPLLFAAQRLIVELSGHLRARGSGLTRLKLILQHEERAPTIVQIGFSSPTRDPQRIARLLRERLARVELPERVEAIQFDSEETRPLASRNLSLFPEEMLPDEERSSIVDHLRARLGEDAVHGIACRDDHRPEQAWRACEPGAAQPAATRARRPLWLLDPPRRLRERDDSPQLEGPLVLHGGPERIEGGWWDGGDVARDYFVASDAQGRQLWIYRERQGQRGWYLQGVFG